MAHSEAALAPGWDPHGLIRSRRSEWLKPSFGPGHMDGSAMPGDGNSVIAAHRDTHFAFLRDLNLGNIILLQHRDGRWLNYTVTQYHEALCAMSPPLAPPIESPK